jgi:hypothetical protein
MFAEGYLSIRCRLPSIFMDHYAGLFWTVVALSCVPATWGGDRELSIATIPDEALGGASRSATKKGAGRSISQEDPARSAVPKQPRERPTTYQQNPFFDKFSIKDY